MKGGEENVVETPLGKIWMDGGILYSRGKKGKREVASTLQHFKAVKKMVGTNKVCCILDFTSSGPSPQNVRDLIRSELANHFNAIAIVSGTAAGKMIGNPYLALHSDKLPVKAFSAIDQAKEWLKKFNTCGPSVPGQ